MNINKTDKEPLLISHFKRVSLYLLIGYFILIVLVNRMIQSYFQYELPEWLSLLYYFLSYLIVALLIWFEKYHLEESNIDIIYITIFILFGSIFRPIFVQTEFLVFFSRVPFIIIAVYLLLSLQKSSYILSKPNKLILWIAFGFLWGIGEWIIRVKSGFTFSRPDQPPLLLSFQPLIFFLNYFINTTLTEEAIFRGFLWSAIKRYGFSNSRILIIIAILFTFSHFYLFQTNSLFSYVYLFVFSLFAGLAAWKSHSVIPGMIAHALHNTIVSIL
jgi:membrane protease YdiL (CAAX protease family)